MERLQDAPDKGCENGDFTIDCGCSSGWASNHIAAFGSLKRHARRIATSAPPLADEIRLADQEPLPRDQRFSRKQQLIEGSLQLCARLNCDKQTRSVRYRHSSRSRCPNRAKADVNMSPMDRRQVGKTVRDSVKTSTSSCRSTASFWNVENFSRHGDLQKK